jgi:hypothetical protein
MLDKIKDRIPSISFSNPFPTDPVGEAIYKRLVTLEPDKAETEFTKLSEASKTAYRTYLRGRDNRDFMKHVTGIAFVGALGTGLVLALTSGEEEDEEDEEDEDSDSDEEDELSDSE